MHSTLRYAAAAVFLGMIAPTAFSADLAFAYRGGQLGDSLAAVEKAIAGKFPRQEHRQLEAVITIVASDSEGARRNRCPVAAQPALSANCLQARFIHWPGDGGLKLTIITVEQSFSTAVPASEVLEKLRSAFGAPARMYADADVAPDLLLSKNDDMALIWGGRRPPTPPYRPSSIIADDYGVIGGKYITALLYRKGRAVSGYELVIADSDRAVSTMQDWKARRVEDAASQQRKGVESIKF